MSELITAVGQLSPYLSAAAASMGTAVLVTARDQLAVSAVRGGRTFLTAALRRRDGAAGPGDEEASGVAGVLEGLTDDERALLEEAVGRWLAGSDLSAAALEAQVVRAARFGRGGDVHVTAHGKHAMAVGRVERDLTISFGADPRAADDPAD
ncbi:hypothetical protein OG250_13450 [Streptomyces sp. NBC_00487]|uniref:hypothetical protein n=1 Tax=unclassified Streptomyces TaxID=2593676 RepID=UPI002DDC507A|nr:MULTISPECIES: hypothetical protein [unclassified Streptomyces]WRY95790.1 hypothetical protein OG889_14220 [Streptomyces sp. NBC_00481]